MGHSDLAAVTVRDVMVGEPIIVPPDMPIQDVVRLMNAHRIGAVLVGVGTSLHGIFTERDLLRLAAHAAVGWRQNPVGEAMTPDPHSIHPDAEWENAMAIMERLHVRHLPVVDDGVIVGIVSSRQLIGRRTLHLDGIVERRTRELQERDRQIQYQMQVAGRLLNRALLPSGPIDAPDLSWAVRYSPLDQVGGDYYDFVRPDDDHLGILIADASGHSVPAAMVAIMARIAFAEVVRATTKPIEVLRGMNERLLGLTEERFVTAFFGLLHRPSRTLTCANAGHPLPIHYVGSQRRCKSFGTRGLMLGVMEDVEYTEDTIVLQSGDRLCFYTDGVIEATDPKGHQFGIHNLEDVLLVGGKKSAAEILQSVLLYLDSFRGHQPPSDDVTLLVGEVK